MTGRHRTLTWTVAFAVGLVVAGLGGYFAVVGLDEADKLASVVGSLAGVIGVGLSVYALTLARRVPETSSENADSVSTPSGDTVTNNVSGTVHGPVFQGLDFTGPITLGSSPTDATEGTYRKPAGEPPSDQT